MSDEKEKGRVFVTGVTGFLASVIIDDLLRHGYKVRASVRRQSHDKPAPHVKKWEKSGLPIQVVEADLLDVESLITNIDGCQFVCHVASPVFFGANESDALSQLITPAVEGTLNVLKAAKLEKVKRVCITSSIAAINGGHPEAPLVENPEELWTDLKADLDPYYKAKTMAEKAAWRFVEDERNDGNQNIFELVVLNPSICLGPTLSPSDGETHRFIKSILMRDKPFTISTELPAVDVRDVARAHRLALEVPEASGERILLTGGSLNYRELSTKFAEEFNPLGYRVATFNVPKPLLRLASLFSSEAREALALIQENKQNYNTHKAHEVLGIEFHDVYDAAIEHAHACIRLSVPGFEKTKGWEDNFSR